MTIDPGGRPASLPSTLLELRRLRRNLRKNQQEIEGDQLSALRRMVAHSQQNVAIYRELYPPRFAERLTSLDDFHGAPIIDKAFLNSRAVDDRRAGPLPPTARTLFTTGSTGEPFRVDYSPAAAWWQGILGLRGRRLTGMRPWYRMAMLPHAPPDPRPGRQLVRVMRRRLVSLRPDASSEELAGELLELRPHVMGGHGHQLVEVGEAAGGRLRPRMVITTGELVTPENFQRLCDLYGREPLDGFGTTEVGIVAWQCKKRDLYHINHEAILAEVVDDSGDPAPAGISGNLLLTGLWNPLMPFLRYRIGDRVAFATRPCKCGSKQRAFDRLEGRREDWLRDDHGRLVSPRELWLSLFLENASELVRRYRIRQDEDGRVTIEVVPRSRIPDHSLDHLPAAYKRVLGERVPVEVSLVDKLELGPWGRFRATVSLQSEPSPPTARGNEI